MAYYAPPLTSTSGFTLGNGSGIAMSGGTASVSASSDGWYPALYSSAVSTDNFFVQATLASAPTSVVGGLIVRGNSSFSQQLMVLFSSSNTYIGIVSGGAGSSSTTEATLATVFASGDVGRIFAIGNVYTVYRNGTSIGTWTDSGGATSTGSSFRLGGLAVQRSSFTNSCSLSNLIIADLPTVVRPNYVPIHRSASY